MIRVRGIDAGGVQVLELPLGHGQDAARLVHHHGWKVVEYTNVSGTSDDLLITARVAPGVGPGELQAATGASVPHGRGGPLADEGLTEAEVEAAVRHQRVAVYAVIASQWGVLLTELSERTSLPGHWNLPGGGVDPGEALDAALHREVHEETGQSFVVDGFLAITTNHWVGRAPNGRVEDFHAVRLIHHGRCLSPTQPVVHDVGGSTSRARWVPVAALAELPYAGHVPAVLGLWLDRGLALPAS